MDNETTAVCSCGCGEMMDLSQDLPHFVFSNQKILCASRDCAERVRATINAGSFPKNACLKALDRPTEASGSIESRNGQVIVPANMILRMRDSAALTLAPRKPFKRRKLH